jgi:hypothetical protein
MTNLAITYLSNNSYCRNPMVLVYAYSLQRHFNGDAVIMTHDMNEENTNLFTRLGFRVIQFDPPPEDVNIFCYRWRTLYQFLRDNETRYRLVFFTDAKDVYWQGNPIPIVDRMLGSMGGVMLCDEGLSHRQCSWNAKEQLKLQNALGTNDDIADWKVVNGGVTAGSLNAMMRYAHLIYTISQIRSNIGVTDQCYVNNLFHHQKHDPNCPYFLINPDRIPWCVTGNTIKNSVEPKQWVDGKLVDKEGRPYVMFHQWDRTPMRKQILDRLMRDL